MGTRPSTGIVGVGRVGMALALALDRAGWGIRAVASRDADRRTAIAALLPRAAVSADPATVAATTDLVLLTVPDDAIADAAAGLGARPGSIVVHTSGAHPAGVLRATVLPAVAVGAFHPLVAFVDVERAVDALHGAWVAIDGDAEAVEVLEDMAHALGARPVVLASGSDPAGAKAAYHAAAVLAAGGFVALLDAITALGAAAGMDEATAVAVYASLVRQGLANSTALGVTDALSGPVLRGDVGTVRRHLQAVDRLVPDVRDLYLATARRQLLIARRHGALDPGQAAELEGLLEA